MSKIHFLQLVFCRNFSQKPRIFTIFSLSTFLCFQIVRNCVKNQIKASKMLTLFETHCCQLKNLVTFSSNANREGRQKF